MAKQSGGYLGGFSGRLGPVVGYQWNGKWCMRALQQFVHNPRTAAQTAHRQMFKQEVQLAASMRWAVTTTMTDAARELGMTSYNLFVKVNQPAFSLNDGVLQVDYSHLLLSMGEVGQVESPTMEWTADNVLTVSFERGRGSSYDLVYLYVYVPELKDGFLSAPAYRRDRRIAVSLPDEFAGCEAHVYLMVQKPDGRWSESLYVGEKVLCEVIDELDSNNLPSDNEMTEEPGNVLDAAPVAGNEGRAAAEGRRRVPAD